MREMRETSIGRSRKARRDLSVLRAVLIILSLNLMNISCLERLKLSNVAILMKCTESSKAVIFNRITTVWVWKKFFWVLFYLKCFSGFIRRKNSSEYDDFIGIYVKMLFIGIYKKTQDFYFILRFEKKSFV